MKGEMEMLSTLRVLGHLCMIAAVGCVVFGLLGESGLLPVAPGLAIVGIVFLSLAAILARLTYIEFLLKSSGMAGTDRVKTDLGDFERLHNVEGQATCVGCRRAAAKTDLYYNKAMDVYYHPECLARDRSR